MPSNRSAEARRFVLRTQFGFDAVRFLYKHGPWCSMALTEHSKGARVEWSWHRSGRVRRWPLMGLLAPSRAKCSWWRSDQGRPDQSMQQAVAHVLRALFADASLSENIDRVPREA